MQSYCRKADNYQMVTMLMLSQDALYLLTAPKQIPYNFLLFSKLGKL